MPPGLPQPVADFLDRHHVMTLATQGPLGPWAAAVFYVRDGRDLVFLSSPRSRHAGQLADDPRCAATVHDECEAWERIRGVQLEGQVHALAGEAERRARARYAERFPVVASLAGAPAALRDAFLRVRWYRLAPRRVLLLDNSLGFGHREAFDLPGEASPPGAAP